MQRLLFRKAHGLPKPGSMRRPIHSHRVLQGVVTIISPGWALLLTQSTKVCCAYYQCYVTDPSNCWLQTESCEILDLGLGWEESVAARQPFFMVYKSQSTTISAAHLACSWKLPAGTETRCECAWEGDTHGESRCRSCAWRRTLNALQHLFTMAQQFFLLSQLLLST